MDASRQGPKLKCTWARLMATTQPIRCFSANSGHFSSIFQIICFVRTTHFSATNQEAVEIK